MRWTLTAWTLIMGVTLFDCWFAWQNRATMPTWEGNPFTATVVAHLGVSAAIAIRLLTLGVCAGLTLVSKGRTQHLSTAVVGVAHVYLAVLYGLIYGG